MIALLLALLFVFAAAGVDAQQPSQAPGQDSLSATASSSSTTPGSSSGQAGSTAGQPQKTSDQLLSSTLAQDISTASYYELVAWCLQLGLDDAGSRPDLQTRLARHYGVTLPQPSATPTSRTVTIRSARESAYRTDDTSKEKFLELRGDVVLEIKDQGKDSLQTIHAAEVTYNQTRRSVSAVGSVTYTLTHAGQTDTFTGDSLAFDLDTSEAVFYDGKTSRTVNRGGKQVPYTFEGETITRLTNDTVILQNGDITTSTATTDPLFEVHASTAWLLAPGEWAAQSALLMLGRVPVLYLPGFFWPGEEFVFNPNVGYQSRAGSFLQTTTYLLGRKQAQDAPFSFLQLSSAGTEGYDVEPDGLFLRKVPSSSTAPQTKDNLKLLLDAYSRLGVFGGITGSFAAFGTFRTGVAFSQDVFVDPTTGYYTPYLPVPVTGYTVGQTVGNSSSLLGLGVPFRYGLDATINASAGASSVTGAFQYYSDPAFTSDFYNRSEAGILAALAQTSTTTATTVAAQTNLSWDLTGKLDFSKAVGSPYVSTLSFPTLGTHMNWQSYTPATGTLGFVEQYDPGASFYYPTSITAPNVTFSVAGELLKLPASAKAAGTPPAPATAPAKTAPAAAPSGAGSPAPATGSSAAGNGSVASGGSPATPAAAPSSPPATTTSAGSTADSAAPAQSQGSAPPTPGGGQPSSAASPAATGGQSSPAAPPAAPPKMADPGKGVRFPLPAAPKKPAPQTVRIPVRPPSPQPDLPTAGPTGASTLDITYQLQPRTTLEHTFDTTNWTTQDAVNYAILYRTLETGGTGTLTAAASLFDKTMDISLGLAADALWRERLSPSAAEAVSADWQSLLSRDLPQDHVTLRSNLTSTLRPFLALAPLSASTLQYSLGVKVYNLAWDQVSTAAPNFTAPAPGWDSNTVAQNSLSATLAYALPWTSDSLALSAQLPPLVPTVTGTLGLGAGPVTLKVQGGVSQPTTGQVFQPLVAGVTATLGTNSSVGEEVQYDIPSATLQRATSTVQVGPLSGNFVAQWMYPVDGVGNQVAGGTIGLLPYTVKLGLETPSNPQWFWKDRIKVDFSLKTHWAFNLQRYTDNLFDFAPSLTLSIFQGLDLTFSSLSTDSKTYRYIPGLAQALGENGVNPFVDLLESFNFFDPTARADSGFKIKTISVSAVQHFPDWDLSFQYQGSPQLRTDPADGLQKYIWTPTFTILVQWNAVPEAKSNIKGDYTGVTLR